MQDSVNMTNKMYHPQEFLEECNLIVNQIMNLIMMNLKALLKNLLKSLLKNLVMNLIVINLVEIMKQNVMLF